MFYNECTISLKSNNNIVMFYNECSISLKDNNKIVYVL
jgi:hypothetical protein